MSARPWRTYTPYPRDFATLAEAQKCAEDYRALTGRFVAVERVPFTRVLVDSIKWDLKGWDGEPPCLPSAHVLTLEGFCRDDAETEERINEHLSERFGFCPSSYWFRLNPDDREICRTCSQ